MSKRSSTWLPSRGKARPRATARHRAAVAFRKLDALCTHYGTGLDQCVEGMIAAVKKHRPLEDGIRAARTLGTIKINDNVVNLGQLLALDNQRLLPGLEAAVSQVAADPLVDQMAKDKLLELQATRNEMKDYLDKPRGTLLSFQNKRAELVRPRPTHLRPICRAPVLSRSAPDVTWSSFRQLFSAAMQVPNHKVASVCRPGACESRHL